MKNPKVGERVAFNTHSDGRKTGTITKIYSDEHVSITPDIKSGTTWLYVARPNELRRLVPKKKRERTYTEAEIQEAYAEAYKANGRGYCFNSVKHYLHKGKCK